MKLIFDISQFRKFYTAIGSVEQQYSEFIKELLLDVAKDTLTSTKELTPVHHGSLRENWKITNVTQHDNIYEIQIFNTLYYASYIEDGHRQRVGRFVPGYIDSSGYFQYQRNYPGGIVLKKPFVNGFHMCRISLERVDSDMKSRFERELKQFLRRNKII